MKDEKKITVEDFKPVKPVEDIVGIQTYHMDEWVNTSHKTLDDLRAEATTFGDGELKKMYLGSSWFEHETYYYLDNMGHTFLFRVIDSFNKEYWKEEAPKRVKSGNKFMSFDTVEK